ncbi:hydroxyethylthiazole kinase [Rhodococcus sp. 27YEA15]|uniref:hydroxyethylthiazole kinase n=1 Tax=Rhodococcus sp. 27YEA15 TaxID=3156259 RepID=UPI003C7E956D
MTDQPTSSRWPDPYVTEALARVREDKPLTFGLTNYIAAPLSANTLLAVGASPAIGGIPDGAAHFATIAGGVWINLAALISDSPQLLLDTAAAADAAGTPWVLDPVTVGAGITSTDQLAAKLVDLRPAVVRGNASEVVALAGGDGGTKGVDSTISSEAAVPYAKSLATRTGGVVAVSGPTDYLTDGKTVIAVPGGHRHLTLVTGAGCSLGGLVAAFAAVNPDRLQAATAAHATLAVAAERAAATTRGTGSFAVALVDELSVLGLDQ